MKPRGWFHSHRWAEVVRLRFHSPSGLLVGQALAEPIGHSRVRPVKVRPRQGSVALLSPHSNVLDGHVCSPFLRILSLWIAVLTSSFPRLLLLYNILPKKKTCQSYKTNLSKTAPNLLTLISCIPPTGVCCGPQPVWEATAQNRGHLWAKSILLGDLRNFLRSSKR